MSGPLLCMTCMGSGVQRPEWGGGVCDHCRGLGLCECRSCWMDRHDETRESLSQEDREADEDRAGRDGADEHDDPTEARERTYGDRL